MSCIMHLSSSVHECSSTFHVHSLVFEACADQVFIFHSLSSFPAIQPFVQKKEKKMHMALQKTRLENTNESKSPEKGKFSLT